MIKAVAIDLDGTLLNDKKELSKKNIEGLKLAKNNGCEILIVTGRSYYSAKQAVEDLNMSLNIICYNGAKVVDENGQVIFEKPLEEKIVRELIEISHNTKIHLNLYQNEIWYVENSNNFETDYYKKNSGLEPQEQNFGIFENYNMTKALFIAENDVLKDLEKKLRDLLGEKVYMAYSDERYLEVLNSEVNKGLTLENILKTKNIDMSECIAFGDAGNDIEMLTNVGWGVAMENASEKVKEKVKFFAKSNNESGVGEYLKNLW